MANEFHNRNFPCAQTVPFVVPPLHLDVRALISFDPFFRSSGPTYPGADTINTVCSISGSIAGQDFVSGDRYINYTYRYYNENKWRSVETFSCLLFSLGLTSVSLRVSIRQKLRNRHRLHVCPARPLYRCLRDGLWIKVQG